MSFQSKFFIFIFMLTTSISYAYKTEADCEEFEGKGQCCRAADGTYHRKAACTALEAAVLGDVVAHNNWVSELERETANYISKSTKLAQIAKAAKGTKDERATAEAAAKAAEAATWGKNYAAKAKAVSLSSWSKLGEITVDFKTSKAKIAIDKKISAGCTAIKALAKNAPIKLDSINIGFEAGDRQKEMLNMAVQANGESQMLYLQCRVVTFSGTRMYIKQNGDCCCEDGTVCHKGGTSGGNCKGCEGDACKGHGGFAVRPNGGYGVQRNITEVQFSYQRLPLSKDKNARVEIWGYKPMLR